MEFQGDKEWIFMPRTTPEYDNGLQRFLDFAFEHRSIDGKFIKCPCPECCSSCINER